MNALIQACDQYLGERTGRYEWRRVRYISAVDEMRYRELSDNDTVFDIGAGWTEFDYCLRVDGDSKCRYIPVDGSHNGVDLEMWEPPRPAEFFVALELLEHLCFPGRLVRSMQENCTKAIIISTPNPETTDVLGMDRTHKTPITKTMLEKWGFKTIIDRSFYGQPRDSIFGVWTP